MAFEANTTGVFCCFVLASVIKPRVNRGHIDRSGRVCSRVVVYMRSWIGLFFIHNTCFAIYISSKFVRPQNFFKSNIF